MKDLTPDCALTDDSGTVVWQGNYSPFGEVNETTDTVEQNIRFPGQYFEEETGLHYNYFRDYDPGTGRYIESDPTGLGAGVNTFEYSFSNPVYHTDFYGLIPSPRRNRCPYKEPIKCNNSKKGSDSEGNSDWVEDGWALITHPSSSCWRRSDPTHPGAGYQCCYKNGDVVPGEGTYDYSMPDGWDIGGHIWEDGRNQGQVFHCHN